MTIIAEWTLHCSHCETPFAHSLPMPRPKEGECLAYQQWVYPTGHQPKMGDPYVCGTCCTWFQPMLEYLSMKRFIGDDHD